MYRWAGCALVAIALACGCGDDLVGDAAPVRWMQSAEILTGTLIRGDVAIDGDSDVVFAAEFEGSFRLGGQVLTSGSEADLFVARLARDDGRTLSLQRLALQGDNHFSDVAVDPGGRTVVLGRTEWVGPFVTVLTAGGEQVWTARFPNGDEWQTSERLAIAPDGDIFVTLHFYETIEIGGEVLESAGGPTDGVLVRLSGDDGAVEWSRQIGNNFWNLGEQLGAVAVGPNGEVALTGHYRGPVDFGGGPRDTYAATQDVFAVVYEADGSYRWSTRIGAEGMEWGRAVAFAPDGDLYVGGEFDRKLPLDGGRELTTKERCAFVLRLAGGDGELAWGRHLAPDAFTELNGMAVDEDGTVLVAGRTQLMEEFPGGSSSDDTGEAAFLVRLSDDGQILGVSLGSAPRRGARSADHLQRARRTTAIAGRFEREIVFGDRRLASPAAWPFVAVFDTP